MRLPLICILIFPALVFGQHFDHLVYKQKINKAYELAINEQAYSRALACTDSVLVEYGMLYGEDYLLRSYCYKSLGNDTLAAFALRTAWLSPTFDFRTTWYIEVLEPMSIQMGFNAYQLSLVQYALDHYDSVRPSKQDSLLSIFRKMSETDHWVRDKNSQDPSNEKWIYAIDSANRAHEVFLDDYIQCCGFPGEKQLGFSDAEIWFVLIHTAGNEAFFERMKSVFLEEVRKGNMSPFYYANWVDQHQFYNRLPSIYNTPTATRIPLTDEQLKQVARNRFEIGLVNVPLVQIRR